MKNIERNPEIELKVALLVKNIGLPASVKGFEYIKHAINLRYVTKDISMMNLYTAIANIYDGNVTRVERAMRHCINKWIIEIDKETLYTYFPKFNGKNIIVSEFICKMVEELKIENLIKEIRG